MSVCDSQVIGFTLIGDSWYTRTRKSLAFESNLVIRADYRGRGLGRESTDIELALGVELGYRVSINDWLASNQRMAHVVRQRTGGRVVAIGTIQRGTFTADRNSADGGFWDDQVGWFTK